MFERRARGLDALQERARLAWQDEDAGVLLTWPPRLRVSPQIPLSTDKPGGLDAVATLPAWLRRDPQLAHVGYRNRAMQPMARRRPEVWLRLGLGLGLGWEE
jgi:hypothetical protein